MKSNNYRLYNEDNEENQDDTSSILYSTHVIDYMRDVFRPKQFVKGTTKDINNKETIQTDETKCQPVLFHSIYDGIYNIDTHKNKSNTKETNKEFSEEEAQQLLERIQKIEEHHPNHSKPTTNESMPFPNFCTNRCGCIECSPRYCDNGDMFCALCSIPIPDGNWYNHTNSISHQVKRRSRKHIYINPFINTKSSMFKLMSSMGWREGEGLGKEGQGRLEPIATRLKDNKLGIGAKDDAPLRITHTPHNDDADPNEDPAVTKERDRLIKKFGLKRFKRIMKKYERKKKEMALKQKEQWLREQFRLYCIC